MYPDTFEETPGSFEIIQNSDFEIDSTEPWLESVPNVMEVINGYCKISVIKYECYIYQEIVPVTDTLKIRFDYTDANDPNTTAYVIGDLDGNGMTKLFNYIPLGEHSYDIKVTPNSTVKIGIGVNVSQDPDEYGFGIFDYFSVKNTFTGLSSVRINNTKLNNIMVLKDHKHFNEYDLEYFDNNPEDFTRFAHGENIGGISIYPNSVKYFFPCTENGGNIIYDIKTYNPTKLDCYEELDCSAGYVDCDEEASCDEEVRCSGNISCAQESQYIDCGYEAACDEEIDCSALETVYSEISNYYNYPERDIRKKSCSGAQDIKFLSTPSNLPILYTEKTLNFKGHDFINTHLKLRGTEKGIYLKFTKALNPVETLTKDRYYVYSDNFKLMYITDTKEYILEFGDVTKVLSLNDTISHEMIINYKDNNLEVRIDGNVSNTQCVFEGTSEIILGNKELDNGIYATFDEIIFSEEILK
jgi:hypothetical protein